MALVNFANRDCGEVTIRDLETMKPFLVLDSCNATAVSSTGDSVYALKRGARSIAFPNPIESTLSFEAQVLPFKAYALFSDGVVETTAVVPFKEEVEASGTSTLTITTANAVAGTVSVYDAADTDFTAPLEVTVADTSITGTFVSGNKYVVRGLVNKTGVERVSFNNSRTPKDFYITIEAPCKCEDGSGAVEVITAYKATPQRSFELSLSATGDPVTLSFAFDCLEDKDGNQLDMVMDK